MMPMQRANKGQLGDSGDSLHASVMVQGAALGLNKFAQ
jgi:hypothetical protein